VTCFLKRPYPSSANGPPGLLATARARWTPLSAGSARSPDAPLAQCAHIHGSQVRGI
jgi:hypothetical protein